jgi:hypothetical protein
MTEWSEQWTLRSYERDGEVFMPWSTESIAPPLGSKRVSVQVVPKQEAEQKIEEAQQPKAGVMHPVDQSFYDLTVKERDAERVRSDRLEEERDQALKQGAERFR